MSRYGRWWSRRRFEVVAKREHRRLLQVAEFSRNEVGEAEPRGRPRMSATEVESEFSDLVGHEVKLPEGAISMSGPTVGMSSRIGPSVLV